MKTTEEQIQEAVTIATRRIMKSNQNWKRELKDGKENNMRKQTRDLIDLINEFKQQHKELFGDGSTEINGRKILFENEMCRKAGLIATCNSCDRIIFEDENLNNEYQNTGYCPECNKKTEK
jgi:hypothetical protein